MEKNVKLFGISWGVMMTLILLLKVSVSPAQHHAFPELAVGMYHVVGTTKMRLMMEKPQGLKAVVKVKDQQGKVLQERMVGKKESKVSVKIDFSQVSDGNYRVEVSCGTDRIIKDIQLFTNVVVETPPRTLVATY